LIKYLGSKRLLVPVLAELARRSGARTAVDLFTGTTRVASAFKQAGLCVTAVDTARYSEVFARCRIELDAASLERDRLAAAVEALDRLPGRDGYFTETFCVASRFFQPFNGRRVDAIRDAIEERYAGTWLHPVLLTSLIEAADRVDSTTGLQMAYVKAWAPRSARPLRLQVPELLRGPGRAVRADACRWVRTMAPTDLAYLDPPYNQHRYYTNYHVWETLTAWDAPAHYGVACKRIDSRDDSTRSAFNSRRTMPDALRQVLGDLPAATVIVSYNDESWLAIDDLVRMCAGRGAVEVLAFDSRRYVGAQIGIFDPGGRKVGRVSHLRNTEFLVVAGEAARVRHMTAPFADARRRGREHLERAAAGGRPA
jgi:adenine-specific DNA-methyltransferase